jgi:serine/threonine protein kinase
MDDYRSERFGRYEILEELGRGAMGVVYKARDPKINRVVAIKTVCLTGQPPEEELEYRERFFREAEAGGRLSHPGIVTIYDVGEEPETRSPYIVMEFVRGPSLEKLLSGDNRQLPLETALQLTLELAEALDCAHGQGVVHRDLKPANILVTEDGHAKIADFGIAKLNLSNLTLAGRALGTPAYMSPEQLNGEAVDGRSDLFSLGVILYTILTGYRPFQGNSAVTVSFKVVNRDPVPATVLDTELPQGLDYIIARAMAKDPAQRYQRGMEMVLDIQELREGREPWSKTKQPGSLAAVDAAQTTNTRSQGWATGNLAVSATPRSSESRGRDAAHKLLEKMRNKSLAGALLLVGLLVFGSQMGRLVWPQKPPARNRARASAAEPMPLTGEVTPVKTGATPITNKPGKSGPGGGADPSARTTVRTSPQSSPATLEAAEPMPLTGEVTPVKTGATPITNKPRKSGPGGGADPSARTTVRTSPQSSPATLEIEVEHTFAEAHLSIWVDDHLTYTHLLEGADKKHLVVFHHVQGHEFHAVQIPPGKHSLRVQVVSAADSYDQSGTVASEFASGKEAMLRITFNKRREMNLSLQ